MSSNGRTLLSCKPVRSLVRLLVRRRFGEQRGCRMSPGLTGAAGLGVLVLAAVLAVVLDLPSGPTGWRRPGPARRVLIGVTVVVLLVALLATWQRLMP